MRNKLLLILLHCCLLSFGQNIPFNIRGVVKDTTNVKYAYLTTLSQRIPISRDKIFMVVPIINGKFSFKGTFELDNKDFQYACLIFDKRGNITKQEAQSKFRQLIWVTGMQKNIKVIALENVGLEIEKGSEALNAKVTAEGKLSKQIDERDAALKEGNRKLLAFVKKYPDSPISLEDVGEVTSIYDESKEEFYKNRYGLPKELFNALSDRQKNSKTGQSLKKKIAAIP